MSFSYASRETENECTPAISGEWAREPWLLSVYPGRREGGILGCEVGGGGGVGVVVTAIAQGHVAASEPQSVEE
jgi:hypothetical protein